ncbi:MAG: helix-turn-helix domain-containing protein [Deltaproteobacteria bacterium]|nr:helix-turn-helix domain-containing protein [Deltaproteobacteria bacterium]
MNILLTVEELAKYLKIKPDTIYKKVRKGELPAIKLGKLVRFPKDLIDQWIIEQATKTMKEVKAARDAVEAKVEEAVSEVKKTAKAASKAVSEVPEVIEDVKNAPLKKKQETLTKGLKGLWKDFNTTTKAPRARVAKKKTQKKGRKVNGKAGAVRVAAAPETRAN